MDNPIKTYRSKKGLTQEQLAEFVGVKKALVSKWENGVAPSPFKAIALEEVTEGEVPRWITRPDLWEEPEAAQ